MEKQMKCSQCGQVFTTIPDRNSFGEVCLCNTCLQQVPNLTITSTKLKSTHLSTKQLDEAMAHFAQITSKTLGTDYCNTPGAGAAGGLGFAFLSYLGAALTPGIELILNAVGLEQELSDADVVVTGEGRLDFQTAMGKAPVGVAKLAKKHHAKVIAFAGSVTKEAAACNKEGIDAFFPILRNVCTLAEAMDPATAKANMTATAEQVFRLL